MPGGQDRRVATIHEQVTSALRDAVRNGEFEPGQPLRQAELAERFGVSAVPVREALRALEQDGIVASLPRRGWIVPKLTVRDIEEVYELREILEQKGLRDAIPRLTGEHLAELERLADKISATSQPDRHLELRERFYQVLYGASGSQRLTSLIMGLHSQLAPYLRRLRVENSSETHRRLMEALIGRDVETASEIISMHLAEIRAACVQAVEPPPADGQRPSDPR
jgi:DNA-binding GntR family transcriptional regulator